MERKEQIRQMIQNLIFDKKDEAKPNLSAAMTEHGKMVHLMVSYLGMPTCPMMLN